MTKSGSIARNGLAPLPCGQLIMEAPGRRFLGKEAVAMSKPRSRVADYGIYLMVRLVVSILQMFPFEFACRVGGALAWLAYHLDGRHRRVADANLSVAFPELDAPSRDRMVHNVYRHLC